MQAGGELTSRHTAIGSNLEGGERDRHLTQPYERQKGAVAPAQSPAREVDIVERHVQVKDADGHGRLKAADAV
jgi:hypothetical protein